MISCIIESRVPFLISLFNFQGPIACPLSKTAQRVYHTLFDLSILFWKFFEIFSNLFAFAFSWLFSLSLEVLTRRQLKEYITYSFVCQDFFWKFFKTFFDWLFNIFSHLCGKLGYNNTSVFICQLFFQHFLWKIYRFVHGFGC